MPPCGYLEAASTAFRILARIPAICGELNIKDFGEREPDITFAPPRELVALRDEERLAQLG